MATSEIARRKDDERPSSAGRHSAGRASVSNSLSDLIVKLTLSPAAEARQSLGVSRAA
jgi:hypothetical protein